ncbi:MAG: cupin domain-containing protein [Candidatus Altiarchaeota archaeon]|nr:cupin domain-containing protein [Candidatus Altiarchaeota archaeon]
MKFNQVKIIEKPWGREIWLAVEKEYAGKILEIKKGLKTSLQYHRRKKESIYVYEGELKVIHPGGESVLKKGESITLNPGDRHRLVAMKDLRLIEISTPELDDVVRVEDDYGRE